MTTLVFFLEEPSAQEMLGSFLPRFLSPMDYDYKFVVFEGKSDLEKRMVMRLREWKKPDCKFVIMRDKDSANCIDVKKSLLQKCKEGRRPDALIRIACYELESWYLGDLQAVEAGIKINGLSGLQRKRRFRKPDEIINSADELEKLTKGRYQKISGSREIGKYLSLENNSSHSFQVFLQGLRKITNDKIA